MIRKGILEQLLKRRELFLFHGFCILIGYLTTIVLISMPEWLKLSASYTVPYIVSSIGCMVSAAIVIKLFNRRMEFQKGFFLETFLIGIVVYPLLALGTDYSFEYFIEHYFFYTSQEVIMQTERLPLYFIFLPNARTIFSIVTIALMSGVSLYLIQKNRARIKILSLQQRK